MLLGDFNGHNVLWGSNDNDHRGELIEDFITKNDICLMNDKSHTFLDSGKGSLSALDLSLRHPSTYIHLHTTKVLWRWASGEAVGVGYTGSCSCRPAHRRLSSIWSFSVRRSSQRNSAVD